MHRLLAAFVILTMALALAPGAALGQEPPPEPFSSIVIVADPDPVDQVFRAVGAPDQPVVPAPPASPEPDFLPTGGSCGGTAPVTATFSVAYVGFSASAQNAFQCAVDILSRRVLSTVPIQVRAEWKDMGAPNILGSAGHGYSFLNNRWHATALASALTGSDVNGGTCTAGSTGGCDMSLTFNSIFSWYLGFDGNAGGSFDFVTVVLHEITHGLGFASLFSMNGTSGDWLGTPYPDIYDTFLVNGANQSLINTSLFPDPSVALGLQLKSNNVWFSGPNTNAANGGKASIYAPATYNGGSSISHLGESFNGTINQLMTYSVAPGEANHDLGPVVKGVLKDIGWTIAEFGLDFTQEPANGAPGTLSPQPRVAVEGHTGATLASDNVTQVTLSLIGTGTLTCTGGLTKTVVSGVATFAGCNVVSAGTYQVRATASAVIPMAGSDSASFTLAAAPSLHLEFTQQPGNAEVGQALSVQPSVAVKDASNVTVAADNATQVTLSLQGGPGTLTCSGGLTKTVSAGVAAYSGCSVNATGTFTLHAVAAPATTTAGDSSSFVISNPPPPIESHHLSAVALGSEVAIFGRNDAGGLWYRETAGGTFAGWTMLGSSGAASRPEAVVQGGDLLVFYRGTADDLRYYLRSSGTWSDHSLGGIIAGFPVAAVDADGDLVVLAVNGAGDPWSRVRASDGTWGSWEPLGGQLSTRLSLTAYNGDVYLAALNMAGSPWVRARSAASGTWGSWVGLGGSLASVPAAAVHGGSLYVVGINAEGVPWYRALTGPSWGPWTTLSGTLANSPALGATGSALVFGGTSGPGPVWDRVLTGAWTPWDPLAGILATGPELVGTSTAAYLFGLSQGGNLWYRRWEANAWGPWTHLGGVLAME